jgi:O-antigen ligase
MNNIGVAVPFGLKPFSTLNDPGLCAVWLAALVLLSLHFRNFMTVLTLPAALLLLPLTLVRSVTTSALLGFVVALFLGRGRMARSGFAVLLGVLGAASMLTLLDPRAGKALVKRFSTIENLGNDQSARTRAEIYATAPDAIASHPLGLGIGALGRGAQASNSEAYPVMDSGPLAIYLALGWFAGTLYLMAFFGVTAQAMMAALDCRAPSALALAAAAVSGVSVILFTNLVGLQGVPIWLASGYAIAIDIRSRKLARSSRAMVPGRAR